MNCLRLFFSFLQIGFTSFGGLSMISVINAEMTGNGWMTAGEVSDIVAIAEMTPGPLGINCATFAGLRVAGLPGALSAMLGVLTPTFTVCVMVGIFFHAVKQSDLMQRILTGVRPACIGLSFAAICSLFAANYFIDSRLSIAALLIGVVGFGLHHFGRINVPTLIFLSAGAGLLLF